MKVDLVSYLKVHTRTYNESIDRVAKNYGE